MSTPKTIQLAKSTLRGKDKEDIYPKSIDTAIEAETVDGEKSTVDQVYLKEANLEGLVDDLPTIKNLVEHEEPHVLSVQVSGDSTMYAGIMLPNTFELDGEGIGSDITLVDKLTTLILHNYNITLQMYKVSESTGRRLTVVELGMECYYDYSENTPHVTGFKYLDGKQVLIIEGLRDAVLDAAYGRASNIPYEACPFSPVEYYKGTQQNPHIKTLGKIRAIELCLGVDENWDSDSTKALIVNSDITSDMICDWVFAGNFVVLMGDGRYYLFPSGGTENVRFTNASGNINVTARAHYEDRTLTLSWT